MIEYKLIDTDDPLYLQELELRDCGLRRPQGRNRTRDDLERDRSGIHFVAVSTGRVIGCLGLYPHGAAIVEMRHVVVDTARRGEGVGGALFAFAETWARDKGFKSIELDGRTSAASFYDACGCAKSGGEYMKHGEPHLKFRKSFAR